MNAHFFDFTPATLRTWCEERGLRSFISEQLMDWVYRKGEIEPERMTNISRADQALLREQMVFLRSEIAAHQRATDGTQKLLMNWIGESKASSGSSMLAQVAPPKQTECVMIPTETRRTACISSQVGCPVGCAFCASGLGGLEGNLSRGQIVEQAWRLNWLPGVDRLTNIVFMGMGEPLANFQHVTDAIRTLNASWGMGLGARRITVSTVGLPSAIRKLVDFDIPVTLALSLHAPNDVIRRELIPWAQYSTITELLDACQEYFDRTGREITLEYILLRNVNDRPEHAAELARVARRLRANINLIRYNEVRGLPFNRPESDDVHRFQAVLRKQGINVHIRASRGRDIAAACGQLRHERRQSPSVDSRAVSSSSQSPGSSST